MLEAETTRLNAQQPSIAPFYQIMYLHTFSDDILSPHTRNRRVAESLSPPYGSEELAVGKSIVTDAGSFIPELER
jgi:trans-2-enoyl-CoA reductase